MKNVSQAITHNAGAAVQQAVEVQAGNAPPPSAAPSVHELPALLSAAGVDVAAVLSVLKRVVETGRRHAADQLLTLGEINQVADLLLESDAMDALEALMKILEPKNDAGK